MILAIDIGNSSVKFGVFDRETLISRFSIPTVRRNSPEEINSLIEKKLVHPISAIVISSVVTELNSAFQQLSEKILRIEPIFVTNQFDFNLKIKYFPPEKLGIDRLVAVFAAAGKYGAPCIVCDFGTATTIDVVSREREFLGGIITPGISTLSEALFAKTSKLPRVEIEKPPRVIGNSTVTAIQSGIFYGYVGLTEGILRRMFEELNEKPTVIATGGFADLIAGNCGLIEIVDENLMLEGLRMIYEKTEK